MGDNSNETTRLTLRLPDDVHDSVLDESKVNMRSLNAEIVILIREALEARESKKNPKQNRHVEVNQVAA